MLDFYIYIISIKGLLLFLLFSIYNQNMNFKFYASIYIRNWNKIYSTHLNNIMK